MSVRLICTAIAAIVPAALAAGCSGASLIEVGGPGDVRCLTSMPALPAVPAAGGTFVVPLAAARECTWQASSGAAWLQVSPRAGQGGGDLTLVVAENRQLQSRTASMTVNDERVTLTQDAGRLLPWRERGRRPDDDDDDDD